MAKRKKSKSRTTRRRGRVSGITSGLLPVLAVAGGAVAVSVAAKKFVPATVNPKLVGGASLLLGLILTSKVKSPIGQGLGFALAASGGLQLASSFGIVSGIGIGAPSIPFRMLAPGREMSIVGNPEGSPQPSVLQGFGLGRLGNPQGSPQASVIHGLAGADLLG